MPVSEKIQNNWFGYYKFMINKIIRVMSIQNSQLSKNRFRVLNSQRKGKMKNTKESSYIRKTWYDILQHTSVTISLSQFIPPAWGKDKYSAAYKKMENCSQNWHINKNGPTPNSNSPMKAGSDIKWISPNT
jgi:hypothetical protein